MHIEIFHKLILKFQFLLVNLLNIIQNVIDTLNLTEINHISFTHNRHTILLEGKTKTYDAMHCSV